MPVKALDYFNSIKVRLKRKKRFDFEYKKAQFQFHKGTIKTATYVSYCLI